MIDWAVAERLHNQGVGYSKIADKLGVHANTVRYHLDYRFRAEQNARAAEYRKAHAAKYRAAKAKRRAQLRDAIVNPDEKKQIEEIYRIAKEEPNVRCYICGKLIPFGERHVDHIIPLSRGGTHTIDNLAIACKRCNLVKHDKLPEEIGIFLSGLSYFEQMSGNKPERSKSGNRVHKTPITQITTTVEGKNDPESRIRFIANEWRGTIDNDPAIDFEDLLQDLRWRYWRYQQGLNVHPSWNLLRQWARLAMRSYGYRGGDHDGVLRHEPRTIWVGDSHYVRDQSVDITDEEMLDFMKYHRTDGVQSKWIPNEE